MTTTQKTTDVTAPRRSHWWWTVPGCLAMVLLNAAVSYGIVRLNAPVTVAFNMKQTVDAFFDSASQKQLSEVQSKALSAPGISWFRPHSPGNILLDLPGDIRSPLYHGRRHQNDRVVFLLPRLQAGLQCRVKTQLSVTALSD